MDKYYKLIPLLLTICTPVLIGAGILASISYYGAFNIDIIDYLTLDESIFLFLKYLAVLMGFTLLGIIYAIKNPKKANPKASESIAVEAEQKPRNYLEFVYLVILIGLIIHRFKIGVVGPITFSLLMLFRTFLVTRLLFRFKPGNLNVHLWLFLYFVGFLINIILFISDYQVIKKYSFDSEKIFELKDGQVIRTGYDTIFVGKTKNYLFYHFKTSNGNLIINSADLKSISSIR